MSMPSKMNGQLSGFHHEVPPPPPPAPKKTEAEEIYIPTSEVLLATGGYDHTIKLWQAHTGTILGSILHSDSQVNSLKISPEGVLLAASGYQHIRMIDLNYGIVFLNFEGVSKNVMDVGFQEDGKWIYAAGEDGTVKIWDLRMRNLQCQRILTIKSPVNALCLHRNQVEIFLCDNNGFIHTWNLKMDKTESFCPEIGTIVNDIDIDPTGHFLSAVNNKGRLLIFSVKTMSSSDGTPESHSIAAHSKYALRCKFAPSGKILVTTSADQTTKLWSTNDFSLIHELTVEKQRWVWDAAFSNDSQYLFTASSDNFARLWSLSDYKVVRKYVGHQKALTSLAFRDGK